MYTPKAKVPIITTHMGIDATEYKSPAAQDKHANNVQKVIPNPNNVNNIDFQNFIALILLVNDLYHPQISLQDQKEARYNYGLSLL